MITIRIIHQLVWVKYLIVIILDISRSFFLFPRGKNPTNLLFDCLSHFDDVSLMRDGEIVICLELFWIIILDLVSVL